MSNDANSNCLTVLMNCTSNEQWAIPQSCLGEIVTCRSNSGNPPARISWRGVTVPVLNLEQDPQSPWCGNDDSGVIAVILGRKGDKHPYWGVAVQSQSLMVKNLGRSVIKDRPDKKLAHALAAFKVDGSLYQVPDLQLLASRLPVH